YWNGLGTQDRVEVDLNYMFRIPLIPGDLCQAWTPDPDVPCQGRLAAFEEVMAGKLVALVDRTAPRDIYDVASFWSAPPAYDARLLRRLFISLSGILPLALTAYGLRLLDAFSWREFESELAPFLRQEEPSKTETLKSMVAALLSGFLNLSADEQAYVERLQRGPEGPIHSAPLGAARCQCSP
ncbi:MAG: nucleotidyl transferase AbiEii/AbiGii toxin family protein, partial [Candidatus Rokubacteria bacterium]|nr:nucleotidyl transferase AbiEii/AbiGii toxin family protein [Candidatus Rokubacteria bacterium]